MLFYTADQDEDPFEALDREAGTSADGGAALGKWSSIDDDGDFDRHSLFGLQEEELEAADQLDDSKEELNTVSVPEQSHKKDDSHTTALMMQALQAEFGTWNQSLSSTDSSDDDETWIGSCSAILIRTVIIRGRLILTNRRLVFVALVPNRAEPLPDKDHKVSSGVSNEIIRKGPVKLHAPGWHRKRHAWLELRQDTLVCYRKSTTIYNPLGSGRLLDLTIHPIGYHPPKVKPDPKRIYLSGPLGTYGLELDTAEAAGLWIKDLEAACWTCKKSRDRVRVSIPLERLGDLEASEYLHLIKMQTSVILGQQKLPTDQGEGESPAEPPSTEDLIFGVLTTHASFTHLAKTAFDEARTRRDAMGRDRLLKETPSPIIEIEGFGQAEGELIRQAAGHQDADGLAAKLVDLFSLRSSPDDLKVLRADIIKRFPIAGTLAIGKEYLIFYRHRLLPFDDVRIKIPLMDLVGVAKTKSFKWHAHAVKVKVHAHSSIVFEFSKEQQRDLLMETLRNIIEERKPSTQAQAERDDTSSHDDEAKLTTNSNEDLHEQDPIAILLNAMGDQHNARAVVPHDTLDKLPRVVNPDAGISITVEPMRICCLTIGSRGDVQPYIALCKGLQQQGHAPVIVSHPEYREWVEKHGIEFREAGGDPGALMELSVEHRLFSPAFFRESLGKFRDWLDELLRETYEACWDAELILESPSAMAGIHIAEKLNCFYMRCFTMTWTATKAYPQAFSIPPIDLGESYNWSSYALFNRVFWQATSGQINRWRRNMLELPSTTFNELDQDTVPFLYNFSSAVVPPPTDWPDRIAVCGYWFLDSKQEGWDAPQDLLDFMKLARDDDKKLVYIGFGSITVPDSNKTTKAIYEAVEAADVRAIVSKGWSDRSSKAKKSEPPPEAPSCVYTVDSIPHDWLFPQIDIALHHGGAGTTGASLRFGLVTLIHPFFGDQFFWAGRVESLGAGLKITSLDADDLADSLKKAKGDRIMVEKAQSVGKGIRTEDGVANAITFINTHLSTSLRRPKMIRQDSEKKVDGSVETPRRDSQAEEEDSEECSKVINEMEQDQRAKALVLLKKTMSLSGKAAVAPLNLAAGSFNLAANVVRKGSGHRKGERRRSSEEASIVQPPASMTSAELEESPVETSSSSSSPPRSASNSPSRHKSQKKKTFSILPGLDGSLTTFIPGLSSSSSHGGAGATTPGEESQDKTSTSRTERATAEDLRRKEGMRERLRQREEKLAKLREGKQDWGKARYVVPQEDKSS